MQCNKDWEHTFGITIEALDNPGWHIRIDLIETELEHRPFALMKVKRIIANIAAPDPASADSFYRNILGLELSMDHGWIRTYVGSTEMNVQVSVASEGGSGTAVPDLSIEVDDLDEALRRVHAANLPVLYGPASEPWGVRRFHVRDPLGRMVNILQHV
ncbi:Imm53 family immunity protein [Stenotrophomonas sp.]|uniref:Imm53 family immunity protein n=1 Tax=Stenotrophomonas sp. TaxID=69392 RepID=UPI00289B4641|nr:Imm53 family immunity protein [Stenotrophomonas sp.]